MSLSSIDTSVRNLLPRPSGILRQVRVESTLREDGPDSHRIDVTFCNGGQLEQVDNMDPVFRMGEQVRVLKGAKLEVLVGSQCQRVRDDGQPHCEINLFAPLESAPPGQCLRQTIHDDGESSLYAPAVGNRLPVRMYIEPDGQVELSGFWRGTGHLSTDGQSAKAVNLSDHQEVELPMLLSPAYFQGGRSL